jgi:hypothetical protein
MSVGQRRQGGSAAEESLDMERLKTEPKVLAAAAALGPVVAAVTGTARYGLVICAAAALGMLARWPRHSAVVWLLRRRGLA